MSTQPPSSTTATRHLDYLDGLRGLAALQVVVWHAGMEIPWGTAASNGITRMAMWPMSFGREAVALFIVLSGFCLMLPVVRRGGRLEGGVWLFFKRRARRILPPYYFALGLSMLLILTIIGQKTHTHWDVALPIDGKAIWSHVLLVQDLFHDTSSRINNVMWSISVEWRIYFLFPLFVIMWREIGAMASTSLILIASYLIVRWLHFDWLNTGAYGMCPQFVGLFALGMFGASAAYSKEGPLKSLREFVPWGALAIFMLAAVIAGREMKFKNILPLPFYLRDYLVGFFSMCLMVLGSLPSGGLVHRVLAWRPIVFLGTFGYSIYLMHSPFLQVFTQYVITPLRLAPVPSFVMLLFLGIPAIVAICYMFYLLCEKPFLNAPVASAGHSNRVECPVASMAVTDKTET